VPSRCPREGGRLKKGGEDFINVPPPTKETGPPSKRKGKGPWESQGVSVFLQKRKGGQEVITSRGNQLCLSAQGWKGGDKKEPGGGKGLQGRELGGTEPEKKKKKKRGVWATIQVRERNRHFKGRKKKKKEEMRGRYPLHFRRLDLIESPCLRTF